MDHSTQGTDAQDALSPPFLSTWVASTFNLWQTLLQNMAPGSSESETGTEKKGQMHISGSLQSWQEMVQSLQNSMLQSGMLDGLPEALNQFPLLGTNMVTMGMNETFRLAQDWMQGMERAAAPPQAEQKNPFQAMAQTYAQSWQKVLNFPQVGPDRFRQQRLNQFLDQANLLTRHMLEFMNQLAVPFEKASIDLQKKMQEMAEGDGYPETFQEYYKEWMKILEGHFMMMLKSEHFIGLLHNVINTYVHYQEIQDQVLEDCLQHLPVPTNDDFDALARENYQLKKQMTQLNKRVEALEAQLQT